MGVTRFTDHEGPGFHEYHVFLSSCSEGTYPRTHLRVQDDRKLLTKIGDPSRERWTLYFTITVSGVTTNPLNDIRRRNFPEFRTRMVHELSPKGVEPPSV